MILFPASSLASQTLSTSLPAVKLSSGPAPAGGWTSPCSSTRAHSGGTEDEVDGALFSPSAASSMSPKSVLSLAAPPWFSLPPTGRANVRGPRGRAIARGTAMQKMWGTRAERELAKERKKRRTRNVQQLSSEKTRAFANHFSSLSFRAIVLSKPTPDRSLSCALVLAASEKLGVSPLLFRSNACSAHCAHAELQCRSRPAAPSSDPSSIRFFAFFIAVPLASSLPPPSTPSPLRLLRRGPRLARLQPRRRSDRLRRRRRHLYLGLASLLRDRGPRGQEAGELKGGARGP